MAEPENFMTHGLTVARMHRVGPDGKLLPKGYCDVCALFAILERACVRPSPKPRRDSKYRQGG